MVNSTQAPTLPHAPHPHAGGVCPIVGLSHKYCPPQKHDSRSPCPALNTLANHGYIPRNGKNLSVWVIINGLKAGYNLSTFLAWFITFGGFFLLRQWGPLSLHDIGKHNHIEHDASLVHHDTPPDDEYAPIDIDPKLVQDLLHDLTPPTTTLSGTRRALFTPTDVARARVRREKKSPPLDSVHAEIARGEMAILLGMMNVLEGGAEGVGVPVEWLEEWIGHERLPEDWKRDHVQGFIETVKISGAIRSAMVTMRKQEAPVRGSVVDSLRSNAGTNGHGDRTSMVSSSSSTLSNSTSTTVGYSSQPETRANSPMTTLGDAEEEKSSEF